MRARDISEISFSVKGKSEQSLLLLDYFIEQFERIGLLYLNMEKPL